MLTFGCGWQQGMPLLPWLCIQQQQQQQKCGIQCTSYSTLNAEEEHVSSDTHTVHPLGWIKGVRGQTGSSVNTPTNKQTNLQQPLSLCS